MKTDLWNIKISVLRFREGEPSRHWQEFSLEINPDETILDVVEKIWAFHDRTLTFRHACHHSTCGACGMRVNGIEKLTCITPIREVTRNNGHLRVEPLRNFPILSDLVVDMTLFFENLEKVHAPQVAANQVGVLPYENITQESVNLERLVDCIECGLCVSACPIAITDAAYLGPASLAGLQQALTASIQETDINLADHHFGAWRCHSAFECSAVCPSNVEPGFRIMDLRKQLMSRNFKKWFGGNEKLR
jgi:succinate dehydrogenase / fumarate reductase iron-sulfur subunit